MPTALTPREMLARLVAFPTISTRSNLDLIGFVEDWLAGHGVASRRVPDASGTKAALFACVGPAVPGGVVLSGHSDVVPVEGQDWTGDPFALREAGGRLIGRGACDMKGFCATALALVPEMLAAGLRRPVILALSYDEELGCQGAPPLIEAILGALPPPEAAVIGEPTGLSVVTGQKGSWIFHGHVRGHEVHSAMLDRGVSAVMAAAGLIDWLAGLTAEAARAAAPNDFDPPCTTVHVGTVQGGTAHNITARDCRFSGEVRCLPDEPVSGWRDRILAEAARREAGLRAVHPDAFIRFETEVEMAGFYSAPPAERLARALTGDESRNVVSYQTEASMFQERGIPAVICGPGSIAEAHQPDEFIAADQLDAGTEVIRRLIRRLAA